MENGWAKVYNLKQLAQAVNYLRENGLMDYAVLEEKLKANGELQKQIVNYTKTRSVYVEYRKVGYSKKFRMEHGGDILLHQAAKKAFDELGYGKGEKLPTVRFLRDEYAIVLSEKKKLYMQYKATRFDMQSIQTAKTHVDLLFGMADRRGPERENERPRQ